MVDWVGGDKEMVVSEDLVVETEKLLFALWTGGLVGGRLRDV